MEILYKTGDVTAATERVIVHGCNAQGVMGSGVAAAIRRRFPQAFAQYREHFEDIGLPLGHIVWAFTSDGYAIGNMITQEYFGHDGARYVDYEAVLKSFTFLNQAMGRPLFDNYGSAVAMPRIGAGLGGGDWKRIAGIIEATSTNYQPVVYGLEA